MGSQCWNETPGFEGSEKVVMREKGATTDMELHREMGPWIFFSVCVRFVEYINLK